ncbi:MAG: hypothetical protein NTX44_04305 [Ignavibacteriales bacterium]|nr:hypothetical protein [Ignavibacteriales bacterium]
MNPYYIFKKELEELETFYKTSAFSIQQIHEIYKHEKKLRGIDIDLKLLVPDKPSFFRKNKQFVLNQQYFLRELILIRLISALEVYLIDNIKFISANNIFIFKTNDIISFTTAEIISYDSITEIFEKLITRDCRKLSSDGFIKIMTYYNTKFKLNISSIFPGEKTMNEYHDRRHLFVHRLGKTDEYYRHKYNVKNVGLSINESYLLKAFKDIKLYAESIEKATKTLIENKPDPKGSKSETLVVFKFNYKEELPEFLNTEFRFWHNDKLVSAKDIIKNISVLEDNYVEVVLFGSSLKVTAFYKNAKSYVSGKKGYSDFQTIQQLVYGTPIQSEKRKHKKKRRIADEQTIEKVKNLLPVQPWNKGVHIEVAEKLGIKKSLVQSAISELIKRGVFKHQIDGKIIE